MAKEHRRMIGVSLGARNTREAEAALREIAAVADIAEIRLDFMSEFDLPRLLANRPCPVIVTYRPEREGGRYRGGEEERAAVLRQAITLGADYVDVEHDAVHLIPDRGNTKLVVSYHDFEKTPPNFVQIHRDLAAKGADVVKIVGMARDARDNLLVFDAFAQSTLPTIAIAMGEEGLPSRVLALRYDTCFLTYATLGTGERVAPGQLPIAAMHEVYQAEQIGPSTAIYGVLANTLASDAALSALNRSTRGAGLDAVWVPILASDNAADVISAYRRLDVAGYRVEGPAQRLVGKALDELAPSAREAGSVNVVVLQGDRLVGHWAESENSVLALVLGIPA